MTLEEFLYYTKEYETLNGKPLAQVMVTPEQFAMLEADAGHFATRKAKGPRLPRNQMVINNVLVVRE